LGRSWAAPERAPRPRQAGSALYANTLANGSSGTTG
jgi:hypothetical protein